MTPSDDKNSKIKFIYQKPATLRSILFKPRKIGKIDEEGWSKPCGKCKLCGNFGKGWESMVNSITGSVKINKQKLKFKHQLTCKDKGIYCAVCTQPGCNQVYVGQTVLQFNKRYSGHRTEWLNSIKNKSTNTKSTQISDKSALSEHYKSCHASVFVSFSKIAITAGFDKAFKIIFIEASDTNVDQREDYYMHS